VEITRNAPSGVEEMNYEQRRVPALYTTKFSKCAIFSAEDHVSALARCKFVPGFIKGSSGQQSLIPSGEQQADGDDRSQYFE